MSGLFLGVEYKLLLLFSQSEWKSKCFDSAQHEQKTLPAWHIESLANVIWDTELKDGVPEDALGESCAEPPIKLSLNISLAVKFNISIQSFAPAENY